MIIAVIDSGFDGDHPDLADPDEPFSERKILPGCDFFDKDNDPDPRTAANTGSLHGTHVAGIAAAIGDNRLGIAGVAYGSNVKILPIKVFSDAATGASLDIFIDALYWLAGEDDEIDDDIVPNPFPPQIINMSLGVKASAVSDQLGSLSAATRAVQRAGILMIAASGNNYVQGNGDENRILIPAADENVMAVGSVDRNYQRSPFSQFDENPDRPGVDIMAPGGYANVGRCSVSGGVLSTLKFDEGFPEPYGCQAGTSMASPFVAGVAALLWSQNPDLSADQVRQLLLNSAFYDASFMSPTAYGSGVVCADRALGAATQCGR